MLLKEWLDNYLEDMIVPELVHKLEVYRLGYVSSSPGHVQFYGAPYIGTQNIWFTTAYEHKLVTNILHLDVQDMTRDLKKVDSEGRSVLVPAIYPDRKVSGELFNLILLYLAHKLHKYPHPHYKELQASLIPLQIYAYRTLAAVHSNSFRYLSNEATAKAVYNKLSNKFILKQLKSWDKYILYRAEAGVTLANERDVLTKFDNDEDNLLILIMMSNGIRSTFKIIYQLYLDTKESGEIEGSDTLMQEGEETHLKEVINAESIANSILLKFADGSYTDVQIAKHVASTIPRVLYLDVLALLKAVSTNYLKHKKDIDTLIHSMSAYAVDRIRTMDDDSMKRTELVDRLFNAFGSSKTKIPVLDSLRSISLTLIMKLIPNKSESYYLRLRSAFILYFIIVWIKVSKL